MAQEIVRGNPVTLEAIVTDGAGQAVDPDVITVSIVNPLGVTELADQVPTRIDTGQYEFVYDVSEVAPLGAWAARWYTVISGVPVTDEDGFTVIATIPAPAYIGAAREFEVCSAWADHTDATGDCATYDTDTVLLDQWMGVASDVLYNFTRRRWPGMCIDYVRPQARFRAWKSPGWWATVAGASSQWGWCTCNRGRETGCSLVPEIKLPGHPVDPDGIEVMLDGDLFYEFRLDDGQYLLRTDGEGWPCCQRLELEDSEAHTFSITYRFGKLPPAGGVRAAATLGCELYKADTANASCALPKRIQSVTRQGITAVMIDPLSLFQNGQVGIASIDLWIASANRGVASRSGSVLYPGRNRTVRRTPLPT